MAGGATAGGMTGGGAATGGGASAGGAAGGSVFTDGGAPQWVLDTGLGAAQLGVLVNDADPISVLVADAYVQARSIPSRNVVHLSFDAGAAITISAGTFTPLKAQADAIAADAGLQAWVITWTRPYRVDCMSIGTAFAAGFDAD